MTVKELIRHLKNFDEDLPVVVRDKYSNLADSIEDVVWEYDGCCKIILERDY